MHLTEPPPLPDQKYDLVGDIHGHADPLHRLLAKLDYVEDNGIYRHPERTMLFAGDFIDRGPEQREALENRARDVRCRIGSGSPRQP